MDTAGIYKSINILQLTTL